MESRLFEGLYLNCLKNKLIFISLVVVPSLKIKNHKTENKNQDLEKTSPHADMEIVADNVG